ncbi:MAG: hypothetical protein ACE5NP_02405 [Anaerolineae bacterium]
MHVVEVDQSGKMEKTRIGTVLAFSNGIQYAILVSATVKRTVLHRLRRRGKSRRAATVLMFAACLFLLLRDHMEHLAHVVIDVEYPGKDAHIRGSLLYHCRRHRIKVHKDQIVFHQVGKKSPAHELALAVYRGEERPDQEISDQELLEVLGIS